MGGQTEYNISSVIANGEEIEWDSQFSLGKGFERSNGIFAN